MNKNFIANIKLLVFFLMVSGCTSPFGEHNSEDATNDATQQGHSKKVITQPTATEEYSEKIVDSRFVVGKGYKIKGSKHKYYPKVDTKYNETGYALWYASSFHGKQTASGPDYDENIYTAAHRTLPLPSVVKVTNLENGKEITVVVNDRGPFLCSNSAIIDLSKSAAQELDIIEKGKAKVKLQYLHEETQRLHTKLPERHRKRAMIALNSSGKKTPSKQ